MIHVWRCQKVLQHVVIAPVPPLNPSFESKFAASSAVWLKKLNLNPGEVNTDTTQFTFFFSIFSVVKRRVYDRF